MKELNKCRIYLQAFFVSDITDINGRYISPLARSGKVYGKAQCMGLDNPEKANKVGSVEETEEDHTTRQHPVRSVMPMYYN
jgi:hypothetical protein